MKIWTEKEVAVLKKYWPIFVDGKITREDVRKVFANSRTWDAIVDKAVRNLKLSPEQAPSALDEAYMKKLDKALGL